MNYPKILPIILCGGSGSRLWPLSRESFPKQYLSINSNDGKTFLQKTQERLNGLDNVEDPIIICNESHRFIVAEQLRAINVSPKKIILEPCGRNTAPAIAIAALNAIENNDDPHLLVLAADHVIKDTDQFLKVIEDAISYSDKGFLVTFGVTPTNPETGFGYIEANENINYESVKGSKIKRFIEKPDLKRAKELIKDNRFFWNSGMFCFKASSIVKEMQKFNSELLENCKLALRNSYPDLDFQKLDDKTFSQCQNISIDNAVMEKTKLGIVIPLNVGWSDIGSWKSLRDLEEKNEDNNVILGNVLPKLSKNCYLRSESRLVVTLGLDNLIVVETNDAVLIANPEYGQEVKRIITELEKMGLTEGNTHKKKYRPWGNYLTISEGKSFQVKKIEVNIGESLSLQLHNHRSEHWIVVKGIAKVELNNKTFFLSENQSTFIPLGSRHRLSNPGKIHLTLIEIQSGDYIGEDDIVRFKDDYGRIND